ncbi:phage portal protein [Ancylobacter sp. IITR112]|uniref:phage portal protein n=1 Tax=Ancylobacter sp. IITR112 TaxID=3138073 RepID=UPI00352B73F7
MKLSRFWRPAEARAASIENPTVPVSSESFLSFFGVGTAGNLPPVTIDAALRVTPVSAAVSFLSRTLAVLPLHAYRRVGDGAQRENGPIEALLAAPNAEMGSYKLRQYMWQQFFTGGRGLIWIERQGDAFENLWALNPSRVAIRRRGMRLFYVVDGEEYPSTDVIDLPFMLRADQTQHYGPIQLASKAIQLALAMNDYGSGFFAGGGVPPLALKGPLPQGAAALKRAQDDVMRSIKDAREGDKPIVNIPAGHDLVPIGLDPEKGQMTEARRFQIEEIARAYQLPPMFLQELSKLSFNNAEQQDLHLVKHLIGQHAKALEDEMNLKLFGRERRDLYVEHNLDGLQRGDFRSRIEGLARAIQTAQITPNEARRLDNRPPDPNPAADQLLVQGATVVLGTGPFAPPPASSPTDPQDGQPDAPQAQQ